MSKYLLISLLVAALSPVTMAQMRGGFGGFHNAGGFHNGFAGQFGHGFRRGGSIWYGDPFFYSDYAQPVYEPAPSPVIVVQPAASSSAPVEPKSEPLMIEWEGDRYVRYSGQRQSAANAALDYSEPSTSSSRISRAELPPVTLVFRDGHRQEVSDYVIANGNLYAHGDYWRDGFWTRTIQLSSLDLLSTARVNSESGVKFVLPSGPNEVVTRP